MPEGRETGSDSDYVSHLSGISRIERTVARSRHSVDKLESSVVNFCVVYDEPIKDSGLWIQSRVAACAAVLGAENFLCRSA